MLCIQISNFDNKLDSHKTPQSKFTVKDLLCFNKCTVRVTRRANRKSNLVRPRGLLSQRTGLCQLGKYAGCVAKGVHPVENGQNRRSGEPGPSRASVNTYGLMSGRNHISSGRNLVVSSTP